MLYVLPVAVAGAVAGAVAVTVAGAVAAGAVAVVAGAVAGVALEKEIQCNYILKNVHSLTCFIKLWMHGGKLVEHKRSERVSIEFQ